MSEREGKLDKKKVIITASAAAGLGITAITIARRYHHDNHDVVVETDDLDGLRDIAPELQGITPTREDLKADVIIAGPDDEGRDLNASQVDGIDVSPKSKLGRWILKIKNGDVYREFRRGRA